MIVTVTLDLIAAPLMFISVLVAVFIAMFVGFHCVMIVRSFLRADQRRRQLPAAATSCRSQPTPPRQKYPSNRMMA